MSPAGVPDVRPLFYAMWVVSEATASGATVMEAPVTSSNPLIKAWGLRSGDEWRVVFVHKDPAAASAASVVVEAAPGGGAGGGALLRHSAANVTAKYGVSYAGRSFDGTENGEPVGAFSPEPVARVGGKFSFSLPPGTAAMLTFI